MTVNEKINIPDRVPIILIAPLDWGLGHATRCIPVIKHLLLIGCEVVVASEGGQRVLLQQEFKDIRFVHLKGYHVKYSKKSWKFLIKIFLQFPKILFSISREAKWVNNFIAKNRINAIISDNRYGFYSKKIPSAFITHQLTIKSPFGSTVERLLRKINYRLISKFNECWVPDYEGIYNLAGELSHPQQLPAIAVKYLGRLSRLQRQEKPGGVNELLILLSGPEPQRSIFENILLDQMNMNSVHAVLVRGLPGEERIPVYHNKNLVIYNHVPAHALNQLINESTIVISRPGYSTVMDLAGLNKKCIFVPTPGQPEQEYLAKYLSSKNLCLSFPQDRFSLQKALTAAGKFKLFSYKEAQEENYKEVVEAFVSKATASMVNGQC